MDLLARIRTILAVSVALAGSTLTVALAAPPSADAGGVRFCGHVLFDYPATSFRVYMRVRDVTCRRAKKVVASSVFGQGAPPIDGWRCPTTSSESGRCLKGTARIVYAAQRGAIPKF